MLELELVPHMLLQAGPGPEVIPTWKRRSIDLVKQRQRREKVRRARPGIGFESSSRRGDTRSAATSYPQRTHLA